MSGKLLIKILAVGIISLQGAYSAAKPQKVISALLAQSREGSQFLQIQTQAKSQENGKKIKAETLISIPLNAVIDGDPNNLRKMNGLIVSGIKNQSLGAIFGSFQSVTSKKEAWLLSLFDAEGIEVYSNSSTEFYMSSRMSSISLKDSYSNLVKTRTSNLEISRIEGATCTIVKSVQTAGQSEPTVTTSETACTELEAKTIDQLVN